MTDTDLYRLVLLALAFDALIFYWWTDGIQPVLMPGKVYKWH